MMRVWTAAQRRGCFLTWESGKSSPTLRGRREIVECVCVHFRLWESNPQRWGVLTTSIAVMTRDLSSVDYTKGPLLPLSPSISPAPSLNVGGTDVM